MKIKVINPATDKLIKEVESDTPESVSAKFKLAKEGQRKWAKVPYSERLRCITKFRELLIAKKESLAATLTSEMGKPISQARNEVNGTLPRIDFFVEHTESVLKTETVMDDRSQNMMEQIGYEPLGVIANISAWNYPYFVGSNVFLPALLTGNAVLYKPSEYSLLTGAAITDLLHEAGIPKDVFILINGTGAIGAELTKQPLNGVFFTGSYGTGKLIAEAAAKQLMKVQLELGGKDPVYVCDDVDVASVAAGVADGAFYNTGQSCCSVERIYVHHKIYDAFVEAFMNNVKTFVPGDPTDAKTYIGALARRELHVDFLQKQVDDALKKGAKLLCGGKKANLPGNLKGYFYEPTVFINVNHTMDLMKEETFGPLIGIQKVQDDEEALKLMNDCAYGLTAGVYTKDKARAQKILAQVNSGSVYWNCCDRVSPRLPWSGRGHSGMGATLSKIGIQTFLQPKGWHLRG